MTCFRGVIFVENRLYFLSLAAVISDTSVTDMLSQDENLIQDLFLLFCVSTPMVSSNIIALILKEARIAS